MRGVHLLGSDCEVKQYKTRFPLGRYRTFVIGGDIGGTHLRLGVGACRDDGVELAFSFLDHTREIDSLGNFLKAMLRHLNHAFNIRIRAFALGVASEQINLDVIPLTHAALKVSKKEIGRVLALSRTRMKFMNDFEALGYGINIVEKKFLKVIQKGKEVKNTTRAAVGAGTGLGKCVLEYDEHTGHYVPIHSEGGRVDFSAYDERDMALFSFIKSQRDFEGPVAFEEVLSSRGVVNLYKFLRYQNKFKPTIYTKEIDESPDKVPLLSLYRKKDTTCREVFNLLSKYYGRCAKDFALDVLSLGGLYVVGGIAHHNPEVLTSKNFITEFKKANDPRYVEILKQMPVIFVDDPLLGLKGACFAASRLLKGKGLAL